MREIKRETEKAEKEKESLGFKFAIEFHTQTEKVNRNVTNIDLNLIDGVNEVSNFVSSFESLLDEYHLLNGKMRHFFGEKYESMFAEKFSCTSEKIEKAIKCGQQKMAEIIENARSAEENRLFVEQERRAAEEERICIDKKLQHEEREQYAENLFTEIKNRCDILVSKCKVNLSELDDYQILDLKKNSFNYTNELNLIWEKVTSFSKDAPYCDGVMGDLWKLRDNVTTDVSLFTGKLDQIVKEKDLSEEKLKRAFELKINIPKFKGYNSELDVYTFRAEFEKLIEPVVQRKLWADYLKRNYLTGTALTLVEKLESIEEIWKKLTDSFGNTRLLLQNKIGTLESIGDLWKIVGDEKIAHALATVINVMDELCTLAKKFKLKEELYYGGCMEKIISLLGNKHERMFICNGSSLQSTKPEVAIATDFSKK